MVNKELRKLNRRELVDIIYQLKKNEQEMQERIAALEEVLQEKRIRIAAAGSIAEAAVDLTNVFSVAQTTADLYLQEIACMKEQTAQACAKLLEDARKKVEKLLHDGQAQCDYEMWKQLLLDMQALEQKADKREDQHG